MPNNKPRFILCEPYLLEVDPDHAETLAAALRAARPVLWQFIDSYQKVRHGSLADADVTGENFPLADDDGESRRVY